MNLPDDNDHLKFDNELKKLKLIAEKGAKFYENENNDLPAEIESMFLHNIEQFEKAFENPISKKIKEILNYPILKATHEISDESITAELELLQELLNDHLISLDVLYEVPDREIYRFITEELLEHEMSVMDIPGMFSCFTYEEFHPNHEENLKQYTVEFIETCVKRDFEDLDYKFTKQIIYHDKSIPCEKFVIHLTKILENQDLTLEAIDFVQIDITEETAIVSFNISLLTNQKSDSRLSHLHFIFEYGYWYIQKVIIPDMGI